MRVISLGWGVQSFTLAAMAALGELEPVEAAIHADTNHESQLTYEFAKRWTAWLQERGVPIITVADKDATTLPPERKGVFFPAFTTKMNKADGQLLRTCTQRWKIAPMRRWLQKHRDGQHVDLLLGISTDEAVRMKVSDVSYLSNCYPLYDKEMSRENCVAWLRAHDLEVPSKSACTFCPYRDTKTWREIQSVAADWNEALAVDRAIRDVNPPYRLYIHPSRKPLETVDFRTPEEQGQIRLWDEECEGLCGV